MRLDVRKYLFFGHQSALQVFYEKAQDLAIVDFIDTGHRKIKEVPNDIQNIASAIKVIRALPTLEQEEPEFQHEADEICEKILELKGSLDSLEEEERVVKLEVSRIDVFGKFSLEDIAYIEDKGSRVVQFFISKKGKKEEKPIPEELIFAGSKYDLDYFIAINKTKKTYENMIEMKIDRGLQELQTRLRQIERSIKAKEIQLKLFAKYNEFLHHALVRRYNDFNLLVAKNYAVEKVNGQLFAVEGWVPKHKLPLLEKELKNLDVYISEIEVEDTDFVPTYLENKGFGRIGEDLVNIYDTPANDDKDPSLWVLFSFAIFFAMIINDGGYGLTFLLAALFIRYKNPKMKGTGKRVWKLSVTLFCFCIAWGILTNSYFGLNLMPDNGLRKVSLLNWLMEKKAEYHFEKKDETYQEWAESYPVVKSAKNSKEFLRGAVKKNNGQVAYDMMDKFSSTIFMELALIAGVIHICLSFLRYIKRNWSGIGWIIAIIGSYMYFPYFLKATSIIHFAFGLNRELIADQGFYLIWIGLGLAVVLSIIKHKIFGLLEITNVIQIFADILSYLRLYALGLAGSIISATVYDIAGSIMIVGSILLIVIGHGLNMILSIAGGIIHGLRLNYIEWYHYSFEGGGKMFNPLRKIEVE